jgi:hypothetical protein
LETGYASFEREAICQSLQDRFELRGARNFPLWFAEFLKIGPSRMVSRVRRKLRIAKKIRAHAELKNVDHL